MAVSSPKAKRRKRPRSKKFCQAVLGKPTGIIQPRVQAVGPEHFGIVAVDCAKARSKWLLADFYGNIHIAPTEIEHRRFDFAQAVAQIQSAQQRHQLKEIIVCVEMTGTYHKPVWRAFRKAGFEMRLVHPFASSHYRLPEHGDVKTDDNDLAAIFRAAVNGFGLLQKEDNPIYGELQVLCRHRRDQVKKKSKLKCQVRHHVEQCLPGFCDLFKDDNLWTQSTPIPLLKAIAARGVTVADIAKAGVDEVYSWLVNENIRIHRPSIEKVIVWAGAAASQDPLARTHTRVWQSLLQDWSAKRHQIAQAENAIVNLLVQTPYVLLLSHPGINVVSAAELAGEMGPIENYASSKAIVGRAGLFPSRYQSDGVDRGGNLSRFRNARLRAAWLLIASNMIKCNQYWRLKFTHWQSQGHDGKDIRCRIANRMTRIVFQMVSGRQLYRHPSRLDKGYVLEKLTVFHQQHKTPPHLIVRDLQLATNQIPKQDHADEAVPLIQRNEKSKRRRRQDPLSLGSLLVGVLAGLGIGAEEESQLKSE